MILNYADLVEGKDLSAEIAKAYGPGGLGICGVKGVPGLQERKALIWAVLLFALGGTMCFVVLKGNQRTTGILGWSPRKDRPTYIYIYICYLGAEKSKETNGRRKPNQDLVSTEVGSASLVVCPFNRNSYCAFNKACYNTIDLPLLLFRF